MSDKSGVGSNLGAGGDKEWSCQQYEEMGNCVWSFSFSMKLFWILQHHIKVIFFSIILLPNLLTLSIDFADFLNKIYNFFGKLYKFLLCSKSHCNLKVDSTDFDSKSYHEGPYILLNILVEYISLS